LFLAGLTYARFAANLPSIEILPVLLNAEDGELLHPTRLTDRSGANTLVTLANPRTGVDGKLCHGYMELRYLLQEALQNSRETILQSGEEFNRSFGRDYANMFWEDRSDDAEITIVAMGSLASEAIVAADMLRSEGIKAGVLGLRVFRPFPKSDVVRALRKSRLIVVFDKNISYGSEGATCSEIKSALYGTYINAAIRNFIVGLGGRDVKARELVEATRKAIASLKETVINPDYPDWICQI
jgi:pyruvate/2-oxoacid:ferredoxin oxidoreductase alpha subunit